MAEMSCRSGAAHDGSYGTQTRDLSLREQHVPQSTRSDGKDVANTATVPCDPKNASRVNVSDKNSKHEDCGLRTRCGQPLPLRPYRALDTPRHPIDRQHRRNQSRLRTTMLFSSACHR